MKTSTPASHSVVPLRDYVRADYVAQAIGMTLSRLENKFRPASWAAPRDFIYTRTEGFKYAVEGLPELVAALAIAEEHEAADLLRAYIVTLAQRPAHYAAPEENKLVPVAHVEAATSELDAAAAGKRHASDREELPSSWAATWEGAQE